MIKGFEVGKTYRFIGKPYEQMGWNSIMEQVYDGKPRRCTKADWDGLMPQDGEEAGMAASFEGLESNFGGSCWDFSESQADFEEVTP